MKARSKGNTSTDLVSLQCLVPRELNARLERQIAGTDLTKRSVIETALARELDRMQKREQAA